MMSQREIDEYDAKHQAFLNERINFRPSRERDRTRSDSEGRLLCSECKSPGRHKSDCSKHEPVSRQRVAQLKSQSEHWLRTQLGLISAELRRRSGA